MPNLSSGQSSNLVRQSPVVAASRMFEALVAVFPMAIFESDMEEISEDEKFKHERLNYPKDHLQSCLQHLDENGLLISITLPYDLGGPVFHQRFADMISAHLSNHAWQSPPLRAGGSAFERWPFRLVTPVQRRQSGYLDKPRTPLVANTFTAATLSAHPYGSTIPNAHNNNQNCFILFAVPVGRNMIGRVDRFPGASTGLLGMHRCAAHRVIEGWDEEKFNHPNTSHIGCWPNCSPTRMLLMMSSQMQLNCWQVNSASFTQNQTSGVGNSTFSQVEILDQDDESLQLALRSSVLETYTQQSEEDDIENHSRRNDRLLGITNPRRSGLPTIPNHSSVQSPLANATSGTSTPTQITAPINSLPDIASDTPPSLPLFVADIGAVPERFDIISGYYPDPVADEDRLFLTLRDGTVQQAADQLFLYILDWISSQHNLVQPPYDIDNDYWQEVVTQKPQSFAGFIHKTQNSWM
ncbi:interleukin-1 receptor-associated kinase 4 [Ceratobasidium sp. AG-Ba]|nr:interleukin-1 receptor-associated kinase 4 [Ceratobasidium sp. AG-Ba]